MNSQVLPSFKHVQLFDAPVMWANENWPWDFVIPDHFDLWYAVSGYGTMWVGGTEYPVTPGTAFVFVPGQHVKAVHKEGSPITNFAARFYPLNAKNQRVDPPEFPLAGIDVHDIALFESVARYIVHLVTAPDKSNKELAAYWVYALAAQAIHDAHSVRNDPADQRILNIVEQHCADPGNRITVSSLAREVGLSRSHFTRRFQRITGKSPSQYLIQRRVDHASHLILHSNSSFEEIADILGYSDVYFFSRQFKNVTGFPPGHMRHSR
jgi:AraC family transcriptional regulator, arabinose operon regulatory protein